MDFQNPEKLGWTRVTTFGKLPEYISVYHSPDWIESTRTNAYIAVIDTKKGGSLDVGGADSGVKLRQNSTSQKKENHLLY